MVHDPEKGSFSADIPVELLADALAAVERRSRGPQAEVEVEVEAPPEPSSPGAPTPAGAGTEVVAAGEPSRAELAAAVRRLEAELAEEHDRLLRSAAAAENARKRAAREREEIERFGVERLVKELLPALDNLERALAAAPAGDPLASGVELTRRQLLDGLGRFGVKGFSARGERFDPRYHEALMTVATADAKPGMVVDEQQGGYFLHDRLLRPAAVVVAAAPPAAKAGEGESGDPT
jgi:molecular chaperone GrpE